MALADGQQQGGLLTVVPHVDFTVALQEEMFVNYLKRSDCKNELMNLSSGWLLLKGS